jgi:small subunit ribosomal protein S3
MGQKTNPIGNRLGIIKGWESSWFGGKDFGAKVVEDENIRKYIRARIPKGSIARIIIERSMKRVTVSIQTARPGTIIGSRGENVDNLREELKKLTSGKDFQINVIEIRKPELDAAIVGENIAKQIEGRMNYRRAIKMAIQATMRTPGAEGIKVRIGGRLNGAEIARREEYKDGRTPLHTFRADIDYALSEAQTVYGKIGIKVWICKGEVFGKRDLSMLAELAATNSYTGGNARRDDRRGGSDRDDRRGGDRKDRKPGGDNRGGNNNRRGGNNNNSGGAKNTGRR